MKQRKKNKKTLSLDTGDKVMGKELREIYKKGKNVKGDIFR